MLVRVDPSPLATHRGPGADACRAVLARYSTGVSRSSAWNALRMVSRVIGTDDPAAVPWHEVTYTRALVVRAELQARYRSPASANLALSLLRAAVKQSWKLGLMAHDDYARVSEIENVTGSRLPKGRSLPTEEVRAMFLAAAASGTARNAALLAVLAAGFRRAEVSSMQLEDVTAEGLVRTVGKGNKERAVWLPPASSEALRAWLRERGGTTGPLFCRFVGGGARIDRAHGLTPAGVYQALESLASVAGVANVSPHDFRRTFAGDLLDLGTDLLTVQKLLGHASPETTKLYDRRPEATGRAATAKLHVPYKEPLP